MTIEKDFGQIFSATYACLGPSHVCGRGSRENRRDHYNILERAQKKRGPSLRRDCQSPPSWGQQTPKITTRMGPAPERRVGLGGKREDVIAALECAWRFFRGVCKRVIPDNAISIVICPNPLDPKLPREMMEYSQHRKLILDPARVESPQDKARVEKYVAFVRERWFTGEKFLSLSHARESASMWSRALALRGRLALAAHFSSPLYFLRERDFDVEEAMRDAESWIAAGRSRPAAGHRSSDTGRQGFGGHSFSPGH
jgi:hypothetical protein